MYASELGIFDSPSTSRCSSQYINSNISKNIIFFWGFQIYGITRQLGRPRSPPPPPPRPEFSVIFNTIFFNVGNSIKREENLKSKFVYTPPPPKIFVNY